MLLGAHDVVPEGRAGVFGGAFSMSMVTDDDQLESAPLLSVAITLMLYVPGWLHLWLALAVDPEEWKLVVVVAPSPQSNVYFS